MNKIDKDYQALLQEYETARNNFQHYSMKVTYGEKLDIKYNAEQANNWDVIIKDLRSKIIKNEQTR
jgi:hypothetical protein